MRSSAKRDRTAELEAIYASLPQIECRGKCADSCHHIIMTRLERERTRAAGYRILPTQSPCAALTWLGTCAVYPVRPLICRLWGLVRRMRCPHGCVPEGGFMPDAQAHALIERVMAIGGGTAVEEP